MINDNAIESAIEEGDTERVREWLARGAGDARLRVRGVGEPFSALVLAARVGRVDIVELLLNSGVAVDHCDYDGETAAHAATDSGHLGTLEWLVARGADLAVRDDRRRTPLHVAVDMQKERIVVALIKAGAPLDIGACALSRAAAMSPRVVLLLMERGIDVRQLRGLDGCTPLHHAAYAGDSVDVMRLLACQIGVDIDARNSRGSTCANVCAFYNHDASLRLLIGAGADIALADHDGNTPLHSTCFADNVRSAVLLLAAGADVNATNIANRTPSSLVVRRNNAADVLHALLAAGADYDARNSDGQLTLRETAALYRAAPPTDAQIDHARRRIARAQLDFVRERALQVCIGLQPLALDALQTCEILLRACGPVAHGVPFHRWWQIATKVKHFVGAK
jgi:ankyrin repeat protein